MATRKAPRWTPTDVTYLKENIGNQPLEVIAQRLNRSVQAIRDKARVLGESAKFDKTGKWTDNEILIVRNNPLLTNDELAGILNRGPKQIDKIRHGLKNGSIVVNGKAKTQTSVSHIKAAPSVKPFTWTLAADSRLITLYGACRTIPNIATELHATEEQVLKRVKSLVRVGSIRQRNPQQIEEKVREMHLKGVFMPEIAKQLNVSDAEVAVLISNLKATRKAAKSAVQMIQHSTYGGKPNMTPKIKPGRYLVVPMKDDRVGDAVIHMDLLTKFVQENSTKLDTTRPVFEIVGMQVKPAFELSFKSAIAINVLG